MTRCFLLRVIRSLFLFGMTAGLSCPCSAQTPTASSLHVAVLNPGEGPSGELAPLLAALADSKTPAKVIESGQLRDFLEPAGGSPLRLLILTDAGRLSPDVCSQIADYSEKGGDLLLLGNPASDPPQPVSLGGATGHYHVYEADGSERASALLNPKDSFALKELPAPLTLGTFSTQAKALYPDTLTPRFGREINWFPIDSKGEPILGSLASSWICGKKDKPDTLSIVSHIGLESHFADQKIFRKLLEPVLACHQAGVVLTNAGPDAASYDPDDAKRFGGRVLNRDGTTHRATIEYEFIRLDDKKSIGRGERNLDIPAGESICWKENFPSHPLEPGDYRLVIRLKNEQGKLLDRQNTRFTVAKLKPTSPEKAVTVKNGHFWLEGKPWFCRGIHYWMPYVVGMADYNFSHEYLMPGIYDPDRVDADLRRMASGKLNTVVVPYRDIREASSLRDFLLRCDKYGLRAIVFIENAHPLRFNLEKLESMIRAAQMNGLPAIFAIDLAWEPHVGPEKEREVLNSQWEKWVNNQYGSLEKAESVWNFSLGEAGHSIRGPSDKEVTEDGPWKVMVAAYRRFLDDQINQGYGIVTRKIKSVCPNVLVGVRTGYGGTGSEWVDNRMPFDLVSGADYLDYISPEAYGLSGNWDGFQNGFLITEAARFAGRHAKPVVWMEYGLSALKVGDTSWSPEKLRLDSQEDYFRNMARLIDETHADGALAWWWVGGYRWDEKSDYGLLDVSGKFRPVFGVLATTGRSESLGQIWKPDTWLTIDRDLHPRGLSMIIAQNRDAFLKLMKEGKRVGFKSSYDGLSTKNFPLVGVGNVEYRGIGPIKGLNGEIHSVEIISPQSSSPIPVGSDTSIPTQSLAEPCRLHLHALNTGNVAWSSDQASDGCVWIEVRANGSTIERKAITEDIPGGKEYQAAIDLEGKVPAGSYSITLASKRTGTFGTAIAFEVKSGSAANPWSDTARFAVCLGKTNFCEAVRKCREENY